MGLGVADKLFTPHWVELELSGCQGRKFTTRSLVWLERKHLLLIFYCASGVHWHSLFLAPLSRMWKFARREAE